MPFPIAKDREYDARTGDDPHGVDGCPSFVSPTILPSCHERQKRRPHCNAWPDVPEIRDRLGRTVISTDPRRGGSSKASAVWGSPSGARMIEGRTLSPRG